MRTGETVDLVAAGARLSVRRDTGFAVLERHRTLQAEGRTEAVEVALQEDPGAALHLLLGAQELALIEHPEAVDGAGGIDGADRADDSTGPDAAELFPDFGAYREPVGDRGAQDPSATEGGERQCSTCR